jgi:hypothetical protein
MNIDKLALQEWLNMYEAAQYLSQKIPKLRAEGRDVLRYALDGHLPLVLNLPTGTNDRQGLELEGGLWDLLTEGERGKPGRQQVEYEHNQHVSLKGITGAWVGRSGAERQLRPAAGYPEESCYGAIPAGCVIGARKSALDRLTKKLEKELAKDGSTASAPKAERVPAEWKDVTITLTSDHQVQIHVGANPSHVQTYGDLGFEDQQQNKPAKAWELFLKLAEAKPQRIDLPPKKDRQSWERETGDTERRQIQNRKDEINSALRTVFERLGYEIPTKPEPIQLDKRNDCYEPNFHIKLSSSYEPNTGPT